VALDEPFVDVLVRFESLGPDRYEASDDGLSVHAQRSGDRVSLGDRLVVVIEDVVLSRRTVYGRRVGPKGPGSASSKAAASPRGRRETGSPRGRREAAPAEKPARSGGQRRSQAGTASGSAGRGQRRGGPGRSR
jgi:ribonuclease R